LLPAIKKGDILHHYGGISYFCPLMQIDLLAAEASTFKKIATRAQHLGMEAWVIGGFVRDKILGRLTLEYSKGKFTVQGFYF
jgi:hypothetical protein